MTAVLKLELEEQRITSLELLQASIKMGVKVPDIFWGIDGLTFTDYRVLQVIYENCAFLQIKKSPIERTEDGCPIVFTSKSKLAKQCGVSEVTFKKSVDVLLKHGIITKRIKKFGRTHGLAVSADYVNRTLDPLEVTHMRHKSQPQYQSFFDQLILNIYNKLNINIYNYLNKDNNNNISEYLSKDRNSCAVPANDLNTNSTDIYVEQEIDNNIEYMNITRKPIIINRKPIISPENIKRKPIVTKSHSDIKGINMEACKKKLEELNEKIPNLNVLEVAKYYEFLCRKALNTTGYRALSYNNPQKHKNWVHFERVYKLCRNNKWDFKLYLEAQFDRVKYWKHGTKYPYANQLYSEGAQNYYKSYVKETKEKMNVSQSYKLKSKHKEITSVKTEIINDVISDCEKIQNYLNSKFAKRITDLTSEQKKALYIMDNCWTMSIYYLYQIPWYKSWLFDYTESNDPLVNEYREKWKAMNKNKSLQNLSRTIVEETESLFNLPETYVENE